MLPQTLSYLYCPNCRADLKCSHDLEWGEVVCVSCEESYPILAGVLILVPDVEDYLLSHAKGISRYVPDQKIPKKYQKDFIQAKKEIESDHIEDDLEAERVTALYIMTHYLKSQEVKSESSEIQKVINDHWDRGPFKKIQTQLNEDFSKDQKKKSLIELGCGSGGLLPMLQKDLSAYLGLDQSFASVLLARHLALGAPLHHEISIPRDLIQGPTSQKVEIAVHPPSFGADFIVCDLTEPPTRPEQWDLCAALNVIDMLPDPEVLARLQYSLLKNGGMAIQSSPYIWHPEVAKNLRREFGNSESTSEGTILALYKKVGFEMKFSQNHVPWVFYKNYRQIELYSTHLFFAQK